MKNHLLAILGVLAPAFFRLPECHATETIFSLLSELAPVSAQPDYSSLLELLSACADEPRFGHFMPRAPS